MGNLYVLPAGGLANKMRAIVSSKIITDYLNYQLHIVDWQENDTQPGFNTIFDSTDYCQLSKLPMDVTTLEITTAGLKLSELNQHTNIYYRTFSSILIADIDRTEWQNKINNGYKQLKLLPPVLNKIPILPENTIGLHIRRGDNLKAIELSPLHLFTQIIEKNKQHNIFLSTDSLEVEQTLLAKYPTLIVNQKQSYINNETIGSNIYNPNNINPKIKTLAYQALLEAVVDLYSLAQCNVIYGSYWSSYSQMASSINNKKLIVLTK